MVKRFDIKIERRSGDITADNQAFDYVFLYLLHYAFSK